VESNACWKFISALRRNSFTSYETISLKQSERAHGSDTQKLFSRVAARIDTHTQLRIAQGAQRRRILLAVIREGEVMAVSGAAIGLLASLVLTRLMTATLYGVTAHDRGTLALVLLLFLGIALLASFIPARRAESVDPTVALRAE
jgi:hypothetical protein